MRGGAIRAFLAALLLPLIAPAQGAAADETVTLRVMTFNVWYGGEQVSLEKIAEAIRSADPDIVGLQEADRNLERIAAAAGMTYVDPRRRLLSRWPIFDSGSGIRTETDPAPYSTTALDHDALHAWVMVRPGKVVAVSNVHLSSGAGLAELRLAETEPLTALGRLAADGTPVFLTGDFNSASHLDTGADGPSVSRMLAIAGMRDSYREAHPDPAASPGFTWTPGAPHPLADHEKRRSRIDYVYAAGRSETVASQVIGEADGPNTDITVVPWPSDHRAVVSTFRVVPKPAPALIAASPRLVPQDGVVLLRTWDPAGPGWTALIARRGGSPPDAITGVRDMPHDYQRTIPISTLGLAPGDYDALLVGEDGTVLRRNAFTIAARGTRPAIESIAASARIGMPIRVRWSGAPGNLRDWVGLYKAGETDVSKYLGFVYTDAAFAGEASLVPDPRGPPVEPGDYEVRLLEDESYVVLATSKVELRR